MAQTKITVNVQVKSALDAPILAKALEQIARHFTAAELLKVAKQLDNPVVRGQIKTML